MPQELLNILISGISVIVMGVCSWGVAVFTTWLNTKIKDTKVATCLTKATTIVTDAVKAIYQEFVQILKEEGNFDDAAQKKAKEKATEIITGQLTTDMKEFISENFGDIQEWISTKIEAVLYNLKNKNQGEIEE